MSVRTFHPRVSVRLYKTIGRTSIGGQPASERFRGGSKTMNLAPFLGEAGGVKVSKSVRGPAGGFSVVLADRVFGGGSDGLAQMESIYGLVEPMDTIEIRMAHEPSEYRGKGLTDELPIVMRGFVSDVTRSESMGADGRPQRSVTISGQDYGKILQIIQIIYFKNYVLGQEILTNFKLFTNYGVGFDADQPVSEFISDVVSKIVNPYLRTVASQNGVDENGKPIAQVNELAVRSSVTAGTVSPFGVNAYEGGSVYDLLRRFGDVGPWNELFTESQEAGEFLIYRPNPLKSLDDKWIQPVAAVFRPSSVKITDQDVVNISVSRSDANVANYYWVDAPSYAVTAPEVMRLMAAKGEESTFFIKDHANSSPYLYGIRKMEAQTMQGASGAPPRQNGQTESDIKKYLPASVARIEERRKSLIDQNKDNVVFEIGGMMLRGNEKIRAGNYIGLSRRNLSSSYYAVGVDHHFVPFNKFTTTVSFERGTSFVNRIAQETPYFSELSGGGLGG